MVIPFPIPNYISTLCCFCLCSRIYIRCGIFINYVRSALKYEYLIQNEKCYYFKKIQHYFALVVNFFFSLQRILHFC